MERNEMFQKISKDTGMDLEQVERVYHSMIQVMSETLCRGEEIVLLPEWGVYIPKEWDNTGLDENSPKTRKPAHYKIRFRPGNKLQKKLVISPEKADRKHLGEMRLNA